MSGHARLEPMSLDDVDDGGGPMLRMPITSSGHPSGSPSLATCARSRAAVFAAGAVMAVVVFVLTGRVDVRGGGPAARPPAPGRPWTVEISLWSDERYILERRRNLSVHLEAPELKLDDRSNSSMAVRYNVSKFGGTRNWSYMRFAVDAYRAAGGGGRDSADADLFERALVGHTFTANLTHDGCVASRDESSIDRTIALLVRLRGGGGGAEDDRLRQLAKDAAVDVEESVFNYLLSSPPDMSVGVNQTWTRAVREVGEPVLVTYTIARHARGGEPQPSVSGRNATATAAYAGRDTEWLVVRVSHDVRVEDANRFVREVEGYAGALAYLNYNVSDARVRASLEGAYVIGARSGLVLDAALTMTTTMNATLASASTKAAALTVTVVEAETASGRLEALAREDACAPQ